MNFGQPQQANDVLFLPAAHENVRTASRLDLNPNILHVQGRSVPDLVLQRISNERDTFK